MTRFVNFIVCALFALGPVCWNINYSNMRTCQRVCLTLLMVVVGFINDISSPDTISMIKTGVSGHV